VQELKSYSYAVVRVVPNVERDEFVNAGVIVYSQERRYLDARVMLHEERLRALAPKIDMAEVRRHLETVPRICAGDVTAGPIAKLGLGERFHWLTAPKSTMIQVSPVRTGICDEPEKLLERLMVEMVE
jgi:Protein of unknown function (DUF3037)